MLVRFYAVNTYTVIKIYLYINMYKMFFLNPKRAGVHEIYGMTSKICKLRNSISHIFYLSLIKLITQRLKCCII